MYASWSVRLCAYIFVFNAISAVVVWFLGHMTSPEMWNVEYWVMWSTLSESIWTGAFYFYLLAARSLKTQLKMWVLGQHLSFFFFFLHWSIIQNVLIEEAVLLYKKMVQFWWISVPFTCCYFLIIPLGVTKVRNVQRGFNFKYLHWKYLAAQYWDSVSGMHCIMLDYLDPDSQHHIRDRVKRCMLICILAIIVILIMTANDSSLWLQFCRFTSAETLRHAVTDEDKTKTDFICFCQSVTSGTY